jgi:quercetin dioxygenase-like cupin family protein
MPAQEILMPKPIRAADQRVVTTANASMTTLASPTQGPSHDLAMWRVEMNAGQRGPMHVFDSEQLWTAQRGTVVINLDGEPLRLDTGDAIVLPAHARRQITAETDATMIVCGHGRAIASVPAEDASRGTPPWIS